MSGIEILVIIVGLLMGYWIVSLFGEGSRTQNQQARQQAWSGPESQRETEARQWQRQAEEFALAPWHEVLNVSPNAEIDEIRRAYKILMSQYHPDKVTSLGPELRELCERKTKEINAAYDQAMSERGAA
ncbi:DnaJ domain-containing protein [Azonexus sp.]|jgi:DnaJ like chaperone protein|uniref:J domain-containing protein n=1 Tax=Azonexus sp. TaxID=1872668 RepID=UPI00282EB64A|nr:DnaJ domain-containing protein [Azonexus sp.]MDR1996272.1 DnaJ domain-containing protein [Azonexus sp.]